MNLNRTRRRHSNANQNDGSQGDSASQKQRTASLSAYGKARSTVQGTPLSADALRKTHAYWRACNYLSLGMIYLQDNPLLQEPLKPEHIKNRLLGHWGASPGLSFVYIHLNRLIKKLRPEHDLPGRTRPRRSRRSGAGLPRGHLLRDLHRTRAKTQTGLREFFKQFSFPGGIGSHCTPETPGSIHEGGELGYVLSHACGAAFDNPDLIVAAVVGDGEAETGPLATSWHISKFLNPIRDGAVLPILHLNGYKINNPTLLARISHEEVENLFRGYGWTPYFVEGSDPESMHQAMAATVEHCISRDPKVSAGSRAAPGIATRPRWPMIVLRTPKGWGAPEKVGGHRLEGFWRAHQVPLADVKKNPEQLEDSRKVDARTKAGGAVRCGWQADSGTQRTGADGHPPDERESARQRRTAQEGLCACPISATTA